MTRSTHKSALMIPIVIIVCAVAAAAQLPTVTITTRNSAQPPHQSGSGNCSNNNSTANNNKAPRLDYIELTGFTITGASNSLLNLPNNIASSKDSIRRRGNSTSQGGNMGGGFCFPGMPCPEPTGGKNPYRIKLDSRRPLLGMSESKSWALLANWYDPSLMLNAIAFELGKRLGLEFSREYRFVRVVFNGTNQGVYMLTPQISGNQYGGVNVDINNGGWLVEFDYHGASDANDCRRFFTAAGYSMNTKIRAPEWDELSPQAVSGFDYVKSDVNGMMNAVNGGSFPNGGHRDIMDLQDWAKYVLVQLFMDNFDFNNKAMSSQNSTPEPGSNYAYKKNKSGKIMAGPLWDFDLAAGVTSGGMDFTLAHFRNYTDMTKPTHPFYTKLWSDPNFLACYVSIWNSNRSMFQSVASTGGLIDSLMNAIAPSVAGNNAQNLSNATETTYKNYVGQLKTWWNNRYTYFNGQMPTSTGTCGGTTPPSGSYTLTVNRNPTAGGNVTVNGGSNNPSPSTHNANASVTVSATANSGYSFVNWTAGSGQSLPSGVNASQSSITFNIGATLTLTANFSQGGDPPPPPPAGDNILRDGDFPGNSLNSSNWSVTNTGSGAAATASVSNNRLTLNPVTPGGETYQPQLIQTGISLTPGSYRLTFTAAAVSGSRSIEVMLQRNGTPSWDEFGSNTFQLTTTSQQYTLDITVSENYTGAQLAFNLGGNLGTGGVVISDVQLVRVGTAPARYEALRSNSASARTRAVIRTDAKGFTAALPANHGYVSYSLVDLRGREIRSGKIGEGVTDLRFSNVNRSVLLLKLKGANGASTVLRAASF